MSLIFTKMNKDLERVVEIPEGVEVSVNENEFTIKGNGKEMVRSFDLGKVGAEVKDGKIILTAKGATRRESTMIGTAWAHLKNIIKGINEEFVYELEVCNVHFPMNVKMEGNKITIKSFLGETTERVAKILPNAKSKEVFLTRGKRSAEKALLVLETPSSDAAIKEAFTLFPDKAEEIRQSRSPQNGKTCTMCGDFCAMTRGYTLFKDDMKGDKRGRES